MKMISEKRMIVTNPLGLSVFFEAGVERDVRKDMIDLAKDAGAVEVEAPKPAPVKRATKKAEEE